MDNPVGNQSSGNSKQKKMTVRVDFTPMVDMNMLLICFFMLCTSMIKPKTMEISMPSDKKDITDDQRNKIKASEAITLILDGDNKLYYFEGLPTIGALKETSYGKDGVRTILLKRNAYAVQQVKKLRLERKQSSSVQNEVKMDEEFKKELLKIKTAKGVPNVVIKATDKATYKNLVDALDEMQICSIGKYVIDKINDLDKQMIEAYKSGNKGTAPATAAQ